VIAISGEYSKHTLLQGKISC